MHFFNPVRYMKLLELVAGEETDPDVMARMKTFGEDQLGKGIVIGKGGAALKKARGGLPHRKSMQGGSGGESFGFLFFRKFGKES